MPAEADGGDKHHQPPPTAGASNFFVCRDTSTARAITHRQGDSPTEDKEVSEARERTPSPSTHPRALRLNVSVRHKQRGSEGYLSVEAGG